MTDILTLEHHVLVYVVDVVGGDRNTTISFTTSGSLGVFFSLSSSSWDVSKWQSDLRQIRSEVEVDTKVMRRTKISLEMVPQS